MESCSFFLGSLYTSLEEPSAQIQTAPPPPDASAVDERQEASAARRDWPSGKSPHSPAQSEEERSMVLDDLRQLTSSLSPEETESSFYIRYAPARPAARVTTPKLPATPVPRV